MNLGYHHYENLSLTDLDNALAEFKTVLELTAPNTEIYKSRAAFLERYELEVKYFKEKWFNLHNQRNFLFQMQVELSMLHESIMDSKNLLDALNQLNNNLNNPYFDGTYPFAVDFRDAVATYQHQAMGVAHSFFKKIEYEKTLPGGIYEKKLLTQMTLSIDEIYKNPFDTNVRQEFFRACNQFPRHVPKVSEQLEPIIQGVAIGCLFITFTALSLSLVATIPAWLVIAAGISFMVGVFAPPLLICPKHYRSETRLRHESGLHDTLLETANVYKKVSPLRQHSIMRMPLLPPAPPPQYEPSRMTL